MTSDALVGDHANDIVGRLAELREDAPVHWWRTRQAHLVLRYDDVARLVHDRTLVGSIGVARRDHVPSGPRPSDHMMIRKDGADHARLRLLVQKAFTPRALQTWRERANSIVGELLHAAADREEIDVVPDYAWPLPVRVISSMLGVPGADVAHLSSLSRAAVDSLEPFLDADRRAELEQQRTALTACMSELVADRRRHPGDDVLTALVHAQEGDDRLTDDEVVQQLVLLYTAGHETTVNLIANALAHLLGAPEQLARLRGDPCLDTTAVEEALRVDGPATMTERRATAPLEVGGTVIEPGDHVVLALSSANRDPRRWGPSADTFDLTRPDARDHVAFGGGPHYCLGAALARLEASIAIPAFVRRFPTAALVEEPVWDRRVMARVLPSLRVATSA